MTILAVSLFNFYTSDKILKQRVEDQLISESTGRGTAIRSLIEERIQQVRLLATNQNIRDVVSQTKSHSINSDNLQRLRVDVASFQEAIGDSIGLDDIKIIDSDGG
ncbi:MAG TPA: hypothetical protein HA292_00120, partial [Candidatus Nitrosotenuis sp.]|nr:hypothetical protein [Candidatus Nitrosotenuis sp.]